MAASFSAFFPVNRATRPSSTSLDLHNRARSQSGKVRPTWDLFLLPARVWQSLWRRKLEVHPSRRPYAVEIGNIFVFFHFFFNSFSASSVPVKSIIRWLHSDHAGFFISFGECCLSSSLIILIEVSGSFPSNPDISTRCNRIPVRSICRKATVTEAATGMSALNDSRDVRHDDRGSMPLGHTEVGI